MSFQVLQSPSCAKACANCPNKLRNVRDCDGHAACPGYGTTANCPPLIVLAVVECARAALAVAAFPAFGSMRGLPA